MTNEKLQKANDLRGSIDLYQGIIEMLDDQEEKQKKYVFRVLDGNRRCYNELSDLLDCNVMDDIERIIKHNLVDKRDKLIKQFKEL